MAAPAMCLSFTDQPTCKLDRSAVFISPVNCCPFMELGADISQMRRRYGYFRCRKLRDKLHLEEIWAITFRMREP